MGHAATESYSFEEKCNLCNKVFKINVKKGDHYISGKCPYCKHVYAFDF